MSAIASRRRRRAAIASVTGLLTLIALPAGLVVGTNSMLNDKGGNNVAEEPTTKLPNTPVGLLAITSGRGELATLAVIALAPGGDGGTIVSMPVGAAAATPAGEPMRRIGDSFANGGLSALTSDVESLLDVTVAESVQVGAVELAQFINQAEPIAVTLSEQVVDSDASGAVSVVLNTGTQEVPSDRVATALASMQSGIAESLRYDQVKELWESYAKGATPVPVVVDPAQEDDTVTEDEVTEDSFVTVSGIVDAPTPADMAGFFTALRAGEIAVWQFVETRVTDVQRNPTSADLYELDPGEIIVVMASVAPSARFIQAGMIGILLDSAISDVSVVKEGAIRIAFMGGNIMVLRDMSNMTVTQTVVRYNDEALLPELQEYISFIGPAVFEKATERIEGIDAQIVLGTDFEKFVKGNTAPLDSNQGNSDDE
jgi:hypothetical protein